MYVSATNHSQFRVFLENVGSKIASGANLIREKVSWCDRQISTYCDVLPHPINIIAEAAIKAFPFIALQAILPGPLFIVSIVGIIIFSIATKDSKEPSHLRPHIQNAIGSRCLYIAGVSAVTFALTGNPVNLLWSISNVAIGALMYLQSHLVQDIFKFGKKEDSPSQIVHRQLKLI